MVRKNLLIVLSAACLLGLGLIHAREMAIAAGKSDMNSMTCEFRKVESPEFKFKKQGDNLTISVNVSIRHSTHSAGTYHTRDKAGSILLHYTVIQNRDHLCRCRKRKDIALSWVIPDGKAKAENYTVFGSIVYPTTKQMERLMSDTTLLEGHEKKKERKELGTP